MYVSAPTVSLLTYHILFIVSATAYIEGGMHVLCCIHVSGISGSHHNLHFPIRMQSEGFKEGIARRARQYADDSLLGSIQAKYGSVEMFLSICNPDHSSHFRYQ